MILARQIDSGLAGFYKRVNTDQFYNAKRNFKKASPEVQKRFVYDVAIAAGVSIFKTAAAVLGPIDIYIKCWPENNTFGMKDLRAIFASRAGQPYHALIVITPAHITKFTEKFAKTSANPIILIPLKEFINMFLCWQHVLIPRDTAPDFSNF